MKKVVVFFLVFSLFSLFFQKKAFSQDQKSGELYNELLSDYRHYQSLLEPFNSSKSRYLAYQSISSQTEFLEASKRLIKAEIEAMYSYASFVKAYLAEATRILNYDENYIYIKLDDELVCLNSVKEKADSVTSLSEAESILKELEVHHQRISLMGHQTKSIVEINTAKKIFDNLKTEKDKIGNFLSLEQADQGKVLASREKLSSLDEEIETISGFVKTAESSYRNYTSKNSASKAEEIWDNVTKSLSIMKSLLREYREIIFNFR